MKQPVQTQKKSLSKRQLRLIDALAGGAELPEALTQCKVSARIFRRWVKCDAFDQELTFRRQFAAQQSQLLIDRFVPVAASKLIGLLESEKEDIVRRTCLDILQLGQQSKKKEEAQTQKSGKSALPPELAEKILKMLSNEKKSV